MNMLQITKLIETLEIDVDKLLSLFVYNPKEPMIFSSGIFLWLFAFFLSIYALLRNKQTSRLLFVTFFSYYFYYKSSGHYFFLLAVVTFSDFFLGIDTAFVCATLLYFLLRILHMSEETCAKSDGCWKQS